MTGSGLVSGETEANVNGSHSATFCSHAGIEFHLHIMFGS